MERYTVYVTPDARREMRDLPGNVRQRTRRAIDALANDPRPARSKQLHAPGSIELRRLRLDRWRIVYAITEADKIVDVLTVRKRPPYDYKDVAQLVQALR